MINTTKELYENLYHRILHACQSQGECRAIVLRIIDHFYSHSALDIAINKRLKESLFPKVLQHVIERLYNQEPIQYILQKSDFCNREFIVTPAVLIPRPETEELTIRILRENIRTDLKILDIGTGSGCIAITLQKELTQAHVDALDINAKALEVARHNAKRNQATINWYQIDILKRALPNKKWDIIVSNPPYICLSEMEYMLPQVLHYEPAAALFVPDSFPLMFYERIIQQASSSLTQNGKLYLEINERFGKEIAALCYRHNFKEASIAKDLSDKDRFIVAAR